MYGWWSKKWWWSLPGAYQRLGCSHIFVAIVDSHHHYVLRRKRAIFRGFRRDFEIVALHPGVGEMADRLYVFPLAGVDGIFRALDRRKSIDRTKRDMKLPTLDGRRQILDARRGRIHLKAAAFFGRRQSLAGRAR